MIHKNIENRRWRDHQKAERKEAISRQVYHLEWYPYFGQYRKGKIHCSCPMCQAKTNTQRFRSRGPVDASRGTRIPATCHRLGNGKKDYRHCDAKAVVAMEQELKEYERLFLTE